MPDKTEYELLKEAGFSDDEILADAGFDLPAIEAEKGGGSGPSLWSEAQGISNEFLKGTAQLGGFGYDLAKVMSSPYQTGLTIGNKLLGKETANPVDVSFSTGSKLADALTTIKPIGLLPVESQGFGHEPETGLGRVAGTVAEFLPAAAIPGGTIASRVGTTALSGLGAGSAEELGFGSGSQLAAALFTPAAVSRIPAAAKSIWNLLTNPRTLQTAGGAVAGSTVGHPVLGGAVGAMLPDMTKAGVRQAAGQRLAGLVDDVDRTKLAEILASPRPLDELTSYRTLGEQLDNPGVASLERGLGAGPLGAELAEDVIKRQAARKGLIEALRPETGTADDVVGAVRQRVGQFNEGLEGALMKAQTGVDDSFSALGQGRTAKEAGDVVDDALLGALEGHKAKVRQLYADSGGIVPTNSLLDDVENSILAKYPGSSRSQAPALLRSFVGDLKQATKSKIVGPDGKAIPRPLTMEELEVFRKRAGFIYGDLVASEGTGAKVAMDFRRNIDDAVDDAVNYGRVTPERAELLKAARAARNEQGKLYEQGAVGEALKIRQYGERAATPSEIPAKFFHSRKGNVEDLDQFLAATKSRPEAVEALTDYAIADLRAAVTRADGTLKPGAAGEWIKKHQAVLQKFPELYNKMDTASKAERLLTTTTKQNAVLQKQMEQSALGHFLKADTDKAIETVFKSNNRAQKATQLVNSLKGNELAKDGLKNSVINYMFKKTTDATDELTNAKMQTFLSENMPALKKIFPDEQHIKNITRVMEDLKSEARYLKTSKVSSREGSTTTQRTLVSAIMALGRSRSPAWAGAFATGARQAAYAAYGSRVDKYILENVRDPAFAAMLIKEGTPQNVEKFLTRFGKGLVEFSKDTANNPQAAAAWAGGNLGDVTAQEASMDTPMPAGMSSLSGGLLEQALMSGFEPGKKKGEEMMMSRIPSLYDSPDEFTDKELRALRIVESGDGKFLNSSKGAQGPYQIMPFMQKAYGLDDPNDEESARVVARRILADEFKRFKDKRLAFAAYNMGGTALAKAIKKAESTDWEKVSKFVPKETREYIPKIEKALAKLG